MTNVVNDPIETKLFLITMVLANLATLVNEFLRVVQSQTVIILHARGILSAIPAK